MNGRWMIFLSMLLTPALVRAGRGDTLVHTQLIADTKPVPGKSFRVGVLFDIEPAWHIYWRNAGDSGLPTTLSLKLPPGYTAGPVQYPLPTKLTLPGDILNYAYEKQAMLWLTVTPPSTAKPDDSIDVDARWLVCQEVCLPGKAELHSTLDRLTVEPTLFDTWKARYPVDHTSEILGVAINATAHGATLVASWNGPAPADVVYFPPPTPNFEMGTISIETKSSTTTIHYQATPTTPSTLPVPTDGLLEFSVAGGRRVGLNLKSSP